jgi:lipopolysaccharide biosynthesis glycosyltransferase
VQANPPLKRTASSKVIQPPHAMKEPVNVVCAGNSRYMMPMSVMLVSLVDHFDPARDLIIHIISNDATAQDRQNVRDSIQMVRPGLNHIEIQWHANDAILPEALRSPKGGYFSSDTFARLFIPDILSKDCERAIYLDSDMIVLADVSKLYDSTVWSDAVIHATHDLGIPWVSSAAGVFDYEERGFPPDTENFSAALLVMNLKSWRERNLTSEMMGYLATHGEKVYVDQGALNAFLCQEWARLDGRWNQGPDVLFEEIWLGAGYTHEEWKRAKNHPYIVHYAGTAKPWNRGLPYPRFSYFYRYLAKTVYRDSVRLAPHGEVFLGFRVYDRLWKVALKIKSLIRSVLPGLFAPAPLMSRHKQNLEAKTRKKNTPIP